MGNRKWPIPVLVTDSLIRGACQELVLAHHPYASFGKGQWWACLQNGVVVCAFLWNPPPAGAAKKFSPGAPWGCLALTRMVGTPKDTRDFHISKPLKFIMKRGVDRGRWPVLLTYSDAGEGHCGNVYRCSGWQKEGVSMSKKYHSSSGARRSAYNNGRMDTTGLVRGQDSEITAWVSRACPAGAELEWLDSHGWKRVRVPGKVWASGRPAHRVVRK